MRSAPHGAADPIACKPAVLAETGDYVVFGSENRALAALPHIDGAEVWEPEAGRRLQMVTLMKRQRGENPVILNLDEQPPRQVNARLQAENLDGACFIIFETGNGCCVSRAALDQAITDEFPDGFTCWRTAEAAMLGQSLLSDAIAFLQHSRQNIQTDRQKGLIGGG